MPTAIDSEGHTITYSCYFTEPSVSYNTATKMITFAATTAKVTTSIVLTLNAKDGELSTSGTTATLTVAHNAPPKYFPEPSTTVVIDHSDFISRDILLPPRT